MGAFCVYGVTKEKAMQRAEKKVPLSRKDRGSEVEAMYEKLFKSMPPVQISGEFDAPQFAQEYVELVKKHMDARAVRVMVRDVKLDKNGSKRLSKRTGKPIMGWMVFKGAI